ncbi:hypothetical protein LX36DRAFT_705161 [Colletotrichum falcatum]|nr:hypothetical protein LX36DRAFT_705161 [Colletotrichum falcatum]
MRGRMLLLSSLVLLPACLHRPGQRAKINTERQIRFSIMEAMWVVVLQIVDVEMRHQAAEEMHACVRPRISPLSVAEASGSLVASGVVAVVAAMAGLMGLVFCYTRIYLGDLPKTTGLPVPDPLQPASLFVQKLQGRATGKLWCILARRNGPWDE